MHLNHPDLDLLLSVSIIAPFIYFGIVEGISKQKQKKKPVLIPSHPFRRKGDDYARYFYIADKYFGLNSIVGRIPRIGALPHAILASIAFKMIVAKGEQCHASRERKTEVS